MDKVLLEPNDDGGTTVRGVDDDGRIIIFYDVNDLSLDVSCTIYSVRSLLSRFDLFDSLDAPDFEYELEKQDETTAKKLHMQSKTTKVSYTFTSQDIISVPTIKLTPKMVGSITFNKNLFKTMKNAVDSMRMSGSYKEKIQFRCKDNKIFMELDDGMADRYVKEIAESKTENHWTHQWKTGSIETLLREALKTKDKVQINVSEKGIAYIMVDYLEFMVAPE